MKKNILLKMIIMIMVFSAALLGCGNPGETEQLETDQNKAEPEEIKESETEVMIPVADEVLIEDVYAETAPDQKIADFLILYYDIPQEYQSEIRYYYNFFDLNEDGTNEIFALLVGDYITNSSGDIGLLLEPSVEGFEVLEDFASIRTPILISDNMVDGWHDIIYPTYGGGNETGYMVCHYTAEGYQTDANEFLEDFPQEISGTRILSNNLIDDMDKGTYLTLAPCDEENP